MVDLLCRLAESCVELLGVDAAGLWWLTDLARDVVTGRADLGPLLTQPDRP